MLIRLTQRRSAGAGLSAARYLGVQVMGRARRSPRGLEVTRGRGVGLCPPGEEMTRSHPHVRGGRGFGDSAPATMCGAFT